MATFGKVLMDSYHALSREAIAESDYGTSNNYSLAEDLVNQFSHGLHPSEWLPRLYNAFDSNAELDDENPDFWLKAREHAETLWREISAE